MSFKSDLELAKENDAFALKKMRGHISFCIERKNIKGLLEMKAVKISALLPEIEEGIKKIEHETARTKQHAKQQKQVFSAELDKCDIYLAQNKPETLGLVASILNQLSKARGKIPPDQELYNLDARYRTMVSRINSAGAKR